MAGVVSIVVQRASASGDQLSKKSDWGSVLSKYNQDRLPEVRGTLCHAPSVNLNFDQSGNATACCYNRRFILGSYPRQSIAEIWNGLKTQQLRDLLKAGDLSRGCQICEHQLRAGNYGGLLARAFDKQAIGDKNDDHSPRTIEFEISNTCNLECVMCSGYFSSSIRRNREKLEPLENVYDEHFVAQLEAFWPKLRQAKFLGGEPFLNPLYYKIWDSIVKINPELEAVITTNATIMNQKVSALLTKLKPRIVVSCDSLDPKVYESIRVNADFKSFYKNLQTFIALGEQHQRPISLAICPMVSNWRTLPEIVNFANRNWVTVYFNTVIWPPEQSIRYLPRAQIKEIHEFLRKETPWPPADTLKWIFSNNNSAYEGLINQICLWETEHRDDEVAGP